MLLPKLRGFIVGQNLLAFNRHPPHLHSPSHQDNPKYYAITPQHIECPLPFTTSSPNPATPHKSIPSLHELQSHTHQRFIIPQSTALLFHPSSTPSEFTLAVPGIFAFTTYCTEIQLVSISLNHRTMLLCNSSEESIRTRHTTRGEVIKLVRR